MIIIKSRKKEKQERRIRKELEGMSIEELKSRLTSTQNLIKKLYDELNSHHEKMNSISALDVAAYSSYFATSIDYMGHIDLQNFVADSIEKEIQDMELLEKILTELIANHNAKIN